MTVTKSIVSHTCARACSRSFVNAPRCLWYDDDDGGDDDDGDGDVPLVAEFHGMGLS